MQKISILLLVIFLAGCSVPTLVGPTYQNQSQSRYIDTEKGNKYGPGFVGVGYNFDSNTLLPDCALNGTYSWTNTISTPDEFEGTGTSIFFIDSQVTLNQVLSNNVSVGFNTNVGTGTDDLISVGVTGNFGSTGTNTLTIDSHSIVIAAKIHQYYGTYQFTNASLKQDALLEIGNLQSFYGKYGASYVEKAYVSADVIYIYKFEYYASNQEERDTHTAELKSAISSLFNIGGKGSDDLALSTICKTSALQSYVYTNITGYIPGEVTNSAEFTAEKQRIQQLSDSNGDEIYKRLPATKMVIKPLSSVVSDAQIKQNLELALQESIWKNTWDRYMQTIIASKYVTDAMNKNSVYTSALNTCIDQSNKCLIRSPGARNPADFKIEFPELDSLYTTYYTTFQVTNTNQLFSANSNSWLYSTDQAEIGILVSVGYSNYGVAWKSWSSSDPDRVPLFRLVGKDNISCFLTTSQPTVQQLVGTGAWVYNRILNYIYTKKVPGTTALYSLYSPQAQRWYFTSNLTQYNSLVGSGLWSNCGITGYVAY